MTNYNNILKADLISELENRDKQIEALKKILIKVKDEHCSDVDPYIKEVCECFNLDLRIEGQQQITLKLPLLIDTTDVNFERDNDVELCINGEFYPITCIEPSDY
jgi:hypothetical protein